eukprot:Skav205197  [mRNA]  locus=scaffold376:36177:42410:+ [translate_table: standard]
MEILQKNEETKKGGSKGGSYGIGEKEKVVVFLCKSETKALKFAQVQSPAEASSEPSSGSRGPAAAETPAATPAPAAPAGQPDGEAVIARLCEMGFERPKVMECLRAACNNEQQAVEYLLTGCPVRERSRSPRATSGAEASADAASALRPNDAALAEIQAATQAVGDDDMEEEEEEATEDSTVEAAPEDLAAIKRLEDLGFSHQQALQAYLVCDRKEEVAANFLFEEQGCRGRVADRASAGESVSHGKPMHENPEQQQLVPARSNLAGMTSAGSQASAACTAEAGVPAGNANLNSSA